MELNPIDYAVVSQALVAAAKEMGSKLIRSAYSTILREARDGSAAILDRNGDTVAQAELIPMQLGSIGAIFKACSAEYPLAEVQPDDFFVVNDPYSGGQHLQDVFFFHPIFFEQELIGFSASVAHHLDLGGGNPGLSIRAADVHSEGLIIPPTKFSMERDWHGGILRRLLRANVRVPAQTMGDFEAQIAANQIGARRVQDLCRKHGPAIILATMAKFQDYTERRTRAGIAAARDGIYFGEDALDDDGISDDPIIVRCKVTIVGSSIEIDYDGTDAQVTTNLNAPFASVISATLACVKTVLTSPDIPFNAGVLRPVTVKVPKGSILNPNYPAPVRARMEACYRAFNATMKALAQAVPDQVIAGGYDTTTVACLSWLGPQRYSVYLEVFGGGYGGSNYSDGCDAVDNALSNCANTPVEAIDQDFEFFRVATYELLPDSFGHGAHRGGAGFKRSYEILRDGVTISLYSDRFRRAPDPLFGGMPGTTGACEILRDGTLISLRSKDTAQLQKGDIVTFRLGGGAGYGDPTHRRPALVRRDIEDGLLSQEAATVYVGSGS